MASLQEIESTLQSINEATFQELCDDYLFWSEEDYPELNRTGSQKGKKKTKKGTPDTFWLLPSGKYVFICFISISPPRFALSSIFILSLDSNQLLKGI